VTHPNWESFIPDLAVGVVTGSVVGFALWLLQRGAEKRAAKREAKAQWEMLRRRIAAKFIGLDSRGLVRDLGAWLPIYLTAVREVENYPLEIWAETLDLSVIRRLHEFAQKTYDLETRTPLLEAEISTKLSELTPPPAFMLDAQTVTRQLILGHDEDKIARVGGAVATAWIPAVQEMLDEPALAAFVESYMTTFRQVEKLFIVLRNELLREQ
jgi:hypothetical protein